MFGGKLIVMLLDRFRGHELQRLGELRLLLGQSDHLDSVSFTASLVKHALFNVTVFSGLGRHDIVVIPGCHLC